MSRSALGLIGWRDPTGRLVSEQFDPLNTQHVELLRIFAEGCPCCRAALAEVEELEGAPARGRPPPVP